MQKSRNYLDHLLKLGTQTTPQDHQCYIKQINLNGMIFFIINLALALVFYITIQDLPITLGFMVASFSFLIASLGFNSMGWTTLSRLSTITIASLLVMSCGFYLGSNSFAAGALLLGAIFPFVHFSMDEKKSIAFCILIPLLCYTVLTVMDYNLGPQFGPLSANALLTLRLTFFLIPFIAIAANTYIAVSEREQKTKISNESQKLLSTIFFALSHDLANPLQTISMISQLGERNGGLPPEKLNKIIVSSKQMLRIFKNLNTIAHTFTTGKITLKMNHWSIKDLIKDAIGFTHEQASAKNINIDFNTLNLTDDFYINVDKDVFIFQVLTNFLTNSLKFSEPGQKISITAELMNSSKVFVTIRDWGQGIESEKLERLFSIEERTSSLGTQGEKGTGLGLPVAMRFLKEMNGELSLSSKHHSVSDPESRGTVVTIKLPLSMPDLDMVT
ncbi:MAG: hypothetical protein A2622_09880 [Bdellovibrionales bacterium RIFCSPHIGHO2_01_FULL_40_29]|nr:MAG: hypothetical protein A2622_09880 [Bdellovibrionales bacterium RIFCSPHIGHO2_01_FULL_40_29]OFZ32443.1 MAG: hypothetical protein A3D17_12780 [Bdellovibrionales bacterium RIFCSPHIGHO2_02_FULL_40_15]